MIPAGMPNDPDVGELIKMRRMITAMVHDQAGYVKSESRVF